MIEVEKVEWEAKVWPQIRDALPGLIHCVHVPRRYGKSLFLKNLGIYAYDASFSIFEADTHRYPHCSSYNHQTVFLVDDYEEVWGWTPVEDVIKRGGTVIMTTSTPLSTPKNLTEYTRHYYPFENK